MKHSAERQRAERRQSESGELERRSESPGQQEGRQSEDGRAEGLERETESPEPRRRSIFERLGGAESGRSVRSGSGAPSDGPRAASLRSEVRRPEGDMEREESPQGVKRRREIGGAGTEATGEAKRTKKSSPGSSRLSREQETGGRGEERNVASERSGLRKPAAQGRIETDLSGGSRAAASGERKHGGGMVRLQPATMGDILRGKAGGIVSAGNVEGKAGGGKGGGSSGVKAATGGAKGSRDVPQSGGEPGAYGGRKRELEEGEIDREASGGLAGDGKVTGGGVASERELTGGEVGGERKVTGRGGVGERIVTGEGGGAPGGSQMQKRGREEGRPEQGEAAKKAKVEERKGEARGKAEGVRKGERKEAAAGGVGTAEDKEKPALKVSGGEVQEENDGRKGDRVEARKRDRLPSSVAKEAGRKETQAGLPRASDRERGKGGLDKSGVRAVAPRELDNRAAPGRDVERKAEGGRDQGKRSEGDRPSQRDARRSPSPRVRERRVERGVGRPSRDARRESSPRVKERQVETDVQKPSDRAGKDALDSRRVDREREREKVSDQRRDPDDRRQERLGGARLHPQSAGKRPDGEAGVRAPGSTPAELEKGARQGHESGRESGQAGKGLYDRELERRRSEKGHSDVVSTKSAEGRREGEVRAKADESRKNSSKSLKDAVGPGAVTESATQGSGLLPRGVVSKPARECEVGMGLEEGRSLEKESSLPSEAEGLQKKDVKSAVERGPAPQSKDVSTRMTSKIREIDGMAKMEVAAKNEAKRPDGEGGLSNKTKRKAVCQSSGVSARLEKPAGKAELAAGKGKVLAEDTEQSEAQQKPAVLSGGPPSEPAHEGNVGEAKEGPWGLSGKTACASGVAVSAGGEENRAEETADLMGDDLGADFLQLEADVDEPQPEPEPRKASITPIFLTLSETYRKC